MIHASWGCGWLKSTIRIYWIAERRYWPPLRRYHRVKTRASSDRERAHRLVSTYPEVGGWARHPWKAILGELCTCFEKSNYVPHFREEDFWIGGFSLKLWANYLTSLSLLHSSWTPLIFIINGVKWFSLKGKDAEKNQ